MIYVHKHDLCIIHVPRTGGTALKEAIACADLDITVHDRTPEEEHMTSYGARQLYPHSLTLVILRNPWDLFESTYAFCKKLFKDPLPFQWAKDMAMIGGLYFEEFVRRAVLIDWFTVGHCGGFFPWYCLPDTEVYIWSEDVNDRILRRLGINGMCKKLNFTDEKEQQWDMGLVRMVGNYCWADIEKFGFSKTIKKAPVAEG